MELQNLLEDFRWSFLLLYSKQRIPKLGYTAQSDNIKTQRLSRCLLGSPAGSSAAGKRR